MRFKRETFYAAVMYFDMFLSGDDLGADPPYQVVGIAAFLIATKLNV